MPAGGDNGRFDVPWPSNTHKQACWSPRDSIPALVILGKTYTYGYKVLYVHRMRRLQIMIDEDHP